MPKDAMNVLIGNNIRRYRKANHLTQEQLAEKVGVSTSFCANIERGGRSMSIQVLINLADALHVSVDSLLCDPSVPANNHSENICALLQNSPEHVSALAEDIVRLIVQHQHQ